MTAQVSKARERFIGRLFFPFLHRTETFGFNQFAYVPKRDARDAILFLVITWLLFFAASCKIGFYCSDVSGAFDRVDSDLLLSKLTASGLPEKLLEVIWS